MKYYFIIDKEGDVLGPCKDLLNKAKDRAVIITTPRPIKEEHEKRRLGMTLAGRLEIERYPSFLQVYIDGRLEQVDLEHVK